MIKNGDSSELLKDIKSDSVDCMVTDPPYGISFMNKNWDNAVPDIAIWKECLRVMKPGAFAFVMCSPRSDVQAEMVIKLKEAGFQVNFTNLYRAYSSGFPKAMNISKAVDRKLGIESDVIGIAKGMAKQNPEFNGTAQGRKENYLKPEYEKTIPTSEEAKRLTGSYAGIQMKPAVEVVIVAMKPLSEKTYVDQALKNGKGITWLDDGRIPYQSDDDFEKRKRGTLKSSPRGRNGIYGVDKNDGIIDTDQYLNESGRFPANLLVQDNVLDNGIISRSGTLLKKHTITKGQTGSFTPDDWIEKEQHPSKDYPSDEGSLSRYFSLDTWYSKNIEELPDYVQKIFPFLYVPKPSSEERNDGLEGEPKQKWLKGGGGTGILYRENIKAKNIHPTVKPVKLMNFLVILGSRKGDTVLDPFMGSGTAGIACKILGREFIGFELKKEYFEIAQERMENIPESVDSYEVDE